MQIAERHIRIDLKERVERTLPRRCRISLVIELDAELAVEVAVGTKFLHWLVFDDARKQHLACHGGVGAHQRVKTSRAQHRITKRTFNAAPGAQRPGRQFPSREDRRRQAAASFMTLAIGGVGFHTPLMFRCLLGAMRSNPLTMSARYGRRCAISSAHSDTSAGTSGAPAKAA